MNRRKRDLWFFILMGSLFLISLIQALTDPTDRPTHLRAYIYGAGLLLMIVALALKTRNRI